MKKTNTAKKAVLPALLAVLCSTAALTSVSYAWFTIGTQASVESIDVDVQAAEGMQISADASSWKSLLPISELSAVTTNEMLQGTDDEFKPVSSALGLTNGSLDLFYGEVQTDGGIIADADQAAGKYVVFDLYVKLAVAKEFYLATGSSVLDTNGSHMASRVAFINEGVVTTGKASDAQALKDGTKAVVWEPNSNEHHTTTNVTGGQNYFGVNSEIEYTSGSKPTDYDNHFTEITEANLLRPSYADGKTTADAKLFDLSAGINKVKVYIWLEGQDVDCINEVSGGQLKTVLNFKVNEN